MHTERLPLPIPESEVSLMLAGRHPCQQLDAAGRYTNASVYAGMTPAEVDAARQRAVVGGDCGFMRHLRECREELPESVRAAMGL